MALRVPTLLATLLLLQCGLQLAHGCSCFFTHLQTDYCRRTSNTYAIMGTITGSEMDPFEEEKYYTITVQYDFKGLPAESVFITDDGEVQVVVSSAMSSAACGAGRLEEGIPYFLMGYASDDGELSINLCGSIERWNEMTDLRKDMLLSGFRGCECEIEEGLILDIDTLEEVEGDERACYGAARPQDYCVRLEDGICTWITA